MCIHNNVKDLAEPFRKGHYYCWEMGGSYSIKNVLPALCGGDPALDYHRLELIHNGSEAMAAFATLHEQPPEEIARVRAALLAYCKLDTLAMVKILEKLYEAPNEFYRNQKPGDVFEIIIEVPEGKENEERPVLEDP